MSQELLRKVYLFEKLTENELNQILSIGREEEFAKDQVIFEENSIGDSFYLILDGTVRISKQNL